MPIHSIHKIKARKYFFCFSQNTNEKYIHNFQKKKAKRLLMKLYKHFKWRKFSKWTVSFIRFIRSRCQRLHRSQLPNSEDPFENLKNIGTKVN